MSRLWQSQFYGSKQPLFPTNFLPNIAINEILDWTSSSCAIIFTVIHFSESFATSCWAIREMMSITLDIFGPPKCCLSTVKFFFFSKIQGYLSTLFSCLLNKFRARRSLSSIKNNGNLSQGIDQNQFVAGKKSTVDNLWRQCNQKPIRLCHSTNCEFTINHNSRSWYWSYSANII